MSCPSSSILDAFGKPGEGVHETRIGPFAAFDVILTAGAALIFFDHYILAFILLVFIGILVHYQLCINTALNVALFGHRGEKNN